jgi:hypothetical protein
MTATIAIIASGEAQPRNAFPAEIIAPMASDCVKEYSALREEAAQRGQLIKAAADRHAQPDEVCKLIGDFGQAEVKMIKYLESHATRCEASTQLTEQLRSGHRKTEAMQIKICAAAREKHAPAGPTGDFWPSPVALPPQELNKPAGPKDFWMTPQSPFVR